MGGRIPLTDYHEVTPAGSCQPQAFELFGGRVIGVHQPDHFTGQPFFHDRRLQRLFLARIAFEIEQQRAKIVRIDPCASLDFHGAAAFGEGERRRDLDVLQFFGLEQVAHMRRHQGVLKERRILGAHRRPHVNVAAIGDIDMTAVQAEESGGAHRCIGRDRGAQRLSLHVGRIGTPKYSRSVGARSIV